MATIGAARALLWVTLLAGCAPASNVARSSAPSTAEQQPTGMPDATASDAIEPHDELLSARNVPRSDPAPAGDRQGTGCRVPSASAWVCAGESETVKVRTALIGVFYNDNYDDGGRRTELTLQREGKEERYTVDGSVRDAVRKGRTYTFVLRPLVWHGSTQMHLVELLDGKRAIYRYENRFQVDSSVALDRERCELEYRYGGEVRRISVPSNVFELSLQPSKVYSLAFHDREQDGASCRKLEQIGELDPGSKVEMFDEMLGRYEVPALRVLWAADAD